MAALHQHRIRPRIGFAAAQVDEADDAAQAEPDRRDAPDEALDHCIAGLDKALSSTDATSNIETLSLAAIALKAAEGNGNPFEEVI